MGQADEPAPADASPRDRLSRLSEATLRINESLEFDTVLQEVVDSARSLTNSRYGVITTLDGSGRPPDFVTSGMTPDEHLALKSFDPEGLPVFEYLSSLEGALRIGDYQSHIASLGLPDFSPVMISSFLTAPIRHGGEPVGTIYVARQDANEEFNGEDEETLMMFASQAALVIANARKHREEQKTRAGLETLIETSPVGVVVFDVRNGSVASLNREAKRIVGDLLESDGSWEHLLGMLTFRRADGREVSLEEYTLAETLSLGETVRAEEITIEHPDGRSVTALINATPIRSEGGEIESFVVTLQDLEPLEKMERLRAEFLGMVSHELRTPLTSIRGSATTLLDTLEDLDLAEARQFFRIIVEQSDSMRGLINDLLDAARIETGTLSVSPESAEVAELVDRARNNFLGSGGTYNLEIEIEPYLPRVMADSRRIVQVITNLLSNAARYSSESATIRVKAARKEFHVAFSVTDEGRGIPANQLPHLFRKYWRPDGGERDRGLAGSGLGLAICKGIVEAHGGRIRAESDGPGLGATFTFTVPAVETEGGLAHAKAAARSRRKATERTRILAVDDDPQALRYIRDALTRAGYDPVVTGDPEDVPRLMEENKPNLVLLDLMLPGTDGIELMQSIMMMGGETPVIFLSAYGQEEFITRAFDMGAIDYVVKPFAPSELAARIRSALRRRSALGGLIQPEPYVLGDVSIDYAQRLVTVAGRLVELTATEYALLFELSVNAGTVLTHDELLSRVWGAGRFVESGQVRTIVKRLRRKLGDDARQPRYIFNVPRVGYRMPKGEYADSEGQ